MSVLIEHEVEHLAERLSMKDVDAIGDKLRYWRLATGTPIEYILEQMLWETKKTYDQYERDYLSDEFIIDCLTLIFGITHDQLINGPSLKILKHYDKEELLKRAE